MDYVVELSPVVTARVAHLSRKADLQTQLDYLTVQAAMGVSALIETDSWAKENPVIVFAAFGNGAGVRVVVDTTTGAGKYVKLAEVNGDWVPVEVLLPDMYSWLWRARNGHYQTSHYLLPSYEIEN